MISTEHSLCLVCNSTKISPIKGYEKFHLNRCNNCGFVFALKIPSEDELEQHYQGYGRNDYFSEITVKRYNEILDKLEKYRSTNRLLDIGCGIGYFLEQAKKRGWEVYGTEYTDKAIEICSNKGIKMQKGILNPNNYSEKFDVITSFEVIEHINNPQEDAKNISSLLNIGGAFYCTTPNFNSISRLITGASWNIIHYPEHLSYYSPSTLKRLLNSVGLKKVFINTTGISITRFKKSKGISDQPLISKDSDDEKLRNSIEQNKLLQLAKNTTNCLLSLFGKGDTIKVLFVKN